MTEAVKEELSIEELKAELENFKAHHEQMETDNQYLINEVKRANLTIRNLQLRIGQLEAEKAILLADQEIAKG